MKIVLKTAFTICLFASIIACSENAETTENKTVVTDENEANQEPEELVEESPLGNYSELVGSWTVDAATAGVKLDLTFGEDGAFKQVMGPVVGDGTWEIVDDEHIKIVTHTTKAEGQTWKVSDLKPETVNLCWNPDAAKPKTLPMTRVK